MKEEKSMLGFKNLVSIDIGSSLIKVVQLGQSSGKIRLEKVGLIDNPISNFRSDGYGVSRRNHPYQRWPECISRYVL